MLTKKLFSIVASLAVSSMLFAAAGKSSDSIKVIGLKADRQENPIGLDRTPQLSWKMESRAPGCLQSAYRILVCSSAENIENSKGDVWDSGKVLSSDCSCIVPPFKLESRKEYFWKVKLWNQDGLSSPWSEVSTFEAALVNQSDWEGGWLGFPPAMIGRIMYFKSGLWIPKPVAKARAYVAGLGNFELLINRQKVGDHFLDPDQSNYSKRVYYVTFDIAPYLQNGTNVVVIPVSQGWLGTPRLRVQIEIQYADGTSQIVNTPWFRSVTCGPTVSSSIFDGECYDARIDDSEIWNPNIPGGEMTNKWAWSHNADDPVGLMQCARVEPIRIIDEIKPRLVAEPAPGVYLFDAGRNLAGWVAFTAHGDCGDKMTIKFGELKYDNGFVNQENMRTAKSADTYVFKGGGDESWEPSFTYHGFRFFQVEGLKYKPSEDDFTVKVVRTAVSRVGSFHSSNPLLNDIYKMIVNTESNNLHSVPTDCCQRDERMGWMNDFTVRIETAMYGFDLSRFYSKFIQDVADTQDELGRIADVAPFRFGNRPADPVSASYLIMAQKCYEFYGDKQIVTEHFDGLKAWVDYLRSRTDEWGCVDYTYYGDWRAPAEFSQAPFYCVSLYTDGHMMSTGYLYFDQVILADMAEAIGKNDIAAQYREYAARTAKAFNARWYNPETGGYGTNNQAANCFALWLGLVEPQNVQRVVDNLVADVQKRDWHLTTGNLCTKYLLEALTDHGHLEDAYKIASQTTYPSWGYMLSKGATSLWETWEYNTDASASHNHPMNGSAGSWFIKYLVGIRPDFNAPGFEHFTLKPHFPADLESVEGSLETVRGKVSCSWSKLGRKVYLTIEIPAGSKATLILPSAKGEQSRELGSGTHTITAKI